MKSKQTLKVGQKYRVIEDSINPNKNGSIVSVSRLGSFNCFYDDNGLFFDMDNDQLQLITPKKEVKKWKYSREQVELWMGAYESYFPKQIRESYKKLREQLLAKQPQEEKKECGCGYHEVCDVCQKVTGNEKDKSPSLLNDIETIEELDTDRDWDVDDVGVKVNEIIKNQRILTEILKEVMEGK